jgi:putative DNA primase/helicase
MGGLPTAESLPAALVTHDQWVVWRTQDRNGTETKVPVDPATGNFASATGPDTWTDFATARAYAAERELGVGFVFTADDPLVGVDLDKCRNPDDGDWTDWATDIVDRLDSYTEVSPSGTGLHVLVEGALPGDRNRSGDIECYDDARFFTVTGDHVDGTPTTVASRQDALRAVHAEYVAADDGDTETAEGTGADRADDTTDDAGVDRAADRAERPADSQHAAGSEPAMPVGNDLDDETLIERARDAANGAKFDRLWRGDTSGYPSQSEADMALCSLLAFWTGGDADQMDRLFRDSGLMREKWDEPHFADGATYGERTIERAIAGSDDFYEPAASGGESAHSDAGDTSDGTAVSPSAGGATQPGDTATAAGTTESGPTSARVPDSGTPAADGETVVPKRVVDDLNETVQALERETEELREELAAREARIAELEAELDAERDTGWLDGLLGRLFGRSG